jgi:outer membrane protein OmpA-like peptidoglycan-associated protein
VDDANLACGFRPLTLASAMQANAAFAAFLARRDGVSTGGPGVGASELKKKPTRSSSKTALLQGPPAASLKNIRRASSTGRDNGARASAVRLQSAMRMALARRKLRAARKHHAKQQAAGAAAEAQVQQRRQWLAEQARQAKEARARAVSESKAAAAEQAASDAAAAEAARAQAERAAAARAEAEAAAVERAATRLREARAASLVGRAVGDFHRRQQQRTEAARGVIGRACVRTVLRERSRAAAREQRERRERLEASASDTIGRSLSRWAQRRRARRAAMVASVAAATVIAAGERRRRGVAHLRRQRRAAAAIAAAWGWHAVRTEAARTIGLALRATLARRRDAEAARAAALLLASQRSASASLLAAAWRSTAARQRMRRLLARTQAEREAAKGAAIRISVAFCGLLCRRRLRAELERHAAEQRRRQAAFERDNKAAAVLGACWATRQQRRQFERERVCAVNVQAHVRGYLERERCPLLAGGKTAFDYPRRLEELSLPFPVNSTKLSAKAKADLAFVLGVLKTQRTLKLRVLGHTLHTEASQIGLTRAHAVVSFLTDKSVLRQQLRAEAAPPPMGEHGEGAVSFLVVQSILLPRRLSFSPSSFSLPESAEPMLEKVLKTLEVHADLGIVLEGHCDASESQATELSGKRAAAVKRWLTERGCRARIGLVPVGRACPVATNGTWQGRRNNRRVEIQIRV